MNAFDKMVILAGIASIGVAALMAGCQSNGVKSDSFPPEITGQCNQARNDAIQNYKAHYGKVPERIPPVAVYLTDDPPQGYGGITSGSGSGYTIMLWRNQRPFYGSLVHEFGHTLKMANGKGGGEENL